SRSRAESRAPETSLCLNSSHRRGGSSGPPPGPPSRASRTLSARGRPSPLFPLSGVSGAFRGGARFGGCSPGGGFCAFGAVGPWAIEASGPRMAPLVGLEQARPAHMGVPLGGGHARVAEHLLDRSDIGTSLQQVRGERVPQRVWRHSPTRKRRARVSSHKPSDV